jgi:hypothetical protein
VDKQREAPSALSDLLKKEQKLVNKISDLKEKFLLDLPVDDIPSGGGWISQESLLLYRKEKELRRIRKRLEKIVQSS